MKTLTRNGESARLNAAGSGEIKVTLTWKRTGLLGRILRGAVDLDLGCYYRLRSGEHGLIDCLQFGEDGGPADRPTPQGCLTQAPWIWHTGDNLGLDRENEEVLIINTEGLAEIERLLVYCYIYDGPAAWDKIDTTLTISAGDDAVAIPVTNAGDHRFIALVEIDSVLNIRRLGTPHAGHADCDTAYGWGFEYD